mmetsp:Transcript_27907/g.71159  ORF Transcript_27907/g.71159 Transcript_27907/m.71159 type:complete len:217 (-) Transcript_27907:889-1539(-)
MTCGSALASCCSAAATTPPRSPRPCARCRRRCTTPTLNRSRVAATRPPLPCPPPPPTTTQPARAMTRAATRPRAPPCTWPWRRRGWRSSWLRRARRHAPLPWGTHSRWITGTRAVCWTAGWVASGAGPPLAAPHPATQRPSVSAVTRGWQGRPQAMRQSATVPAGPHLACRAHRPAATRPWQVRALPLLLSTPRTQAPAPSRSHPATAATCLAAQS